MNRLLGEKNFRTCCCSRPPQGNYKDRFAGCTGEERREKCLRSSCGRVDPSYPDNDSRTAYLQIRLGAYEHGLRGRPKPEMRVRSSPSHGDPLGGPVRARGLAIHGVCDLQNHIRGSELPVVEVGAERVHARHPGHIADDLHAVVAKMPDALTGAEGPVGVDDANYDGFHLRFWGENVVVYLRDCTNFCEIMTHSHKNEGAAEIR